MLTAVYECGNFSRDDDPPEQCPACGADEREEQPDPMSTVSVSCPGWYDNE